MRSLLTFFMLTLPTLLMAQDTATVIAPAGKKRIKELILVNRDTMPQATQAYVLIQGKVYEALIIGQDTVPLVSLPLVNAVAKRTFPNKRAQRKHEKLVFHVKKVLPYAKLAGERMREVDVELATMKPAERKKRLRELEREIKRDYEGELKKLTFTQGRILIKLLDRETNMVSYDIVKHFRGGFTAWFFQGIAKMFSYDLKDEYNPERDDRLIESIVQQVERGEL